jgi:hypothetical protein
MVADVCAQTLVAMRQHASATMDLILVMNIDNVGGQQAFHGAPFLKRYWMKLNLA